jgi:hypothetical protein
MTNRQYRIQVRHKRAQHEAVTAVIIALLLTSLLVVKFAVNNAFQHDLQQHNQELQR